MKAFLRLTALFSALILLALGAGEIYVRHLPNHDRIVGLVNANAYRFLEARTPA